MLTNSLRESPEQRARSTAQEALKQRARDLLLPHRLPWGLRGACGPDPGRGREIRKASMDAFSGCSTQNCHRCNGYSHTSGNLPVSSCPTLGAPAAFASLPTSLIA